MNFVLGVGQPQGQFNTDRSFFWLHDSLIGNIDINMLYLQDLSIY